MVSVLLKHSNCQHQGLDCERHCILRAGKIKKLDQDWALCSAESAGDSATTVEVVAEKREDDGRMGS